MKPKLDYTDTALIAALRANGRASVVALARQVGLSRSSVQERLARLERDGVIAGYTVNVNEPDVTPTASAFLLVTLTKDVCTRIVGELRRIDGVRRCDAVTGDVDLILEIEAPDMAQVTAIRDRIAARPDVGSVRSYMVMPRG